MQADLYNSQGEKVGQIDLPDSLFAQPVNLALLKQAVDVYLANQRQGTHSTKTRGEVRGGGRKPWRQKHTGRARHGSIRSPIWRKGGIVFGPKPRSYRRLLPKKMRRAALKSALSLRAQGGDVLVVEGWKAEKPRTKEFKALLDKLPRTGKTVLFVTADYEPAVYLSGRNLPGVTVMEARELSPYQVLRHRQLILVQDALGRLEEVFA